MGHLSFDGKGKVIKGTPDRWLPLAAQIAEYARDFSKRGDIQANVGPGIGGEFATACWNPAIADMDVNTDTCLPGIPAERADFHDKVFQLGALPFIGAVTHEAAHARWTGWVPLDLINRQRNGYEQWSQATIEVIIALEESRIETLAVGADKDKRTALAQCALSIVLKDFKVNNTLFGASISLALTVGRYALLSPAEISRFRALIAPHLPYGLMPRLEALIREYHRLPARDVARRALTDADFEAMFDIAQRWLVAIRETAAKVKEEQERRAREEAERREKEEAEPDPGEEHEAPSEDDPAEPGDGDEDVPEDAETVVVSAGNESGDEPNEHPEDPASGEGGAGGSADAGAPGDGEGEPTEDSEDEPEAGEAEAEEPGEDADDEPESADDDADGASDEDADPDAPEGSAGDEDADGEADGGGDEDEPADDGDAAGSEPDGEDPDEGEGEPEPERNMREEQPDLRSGIPGEDDETGATVIVIIIDPEAKPEPEPEPEAEADEPEDSPLGEDIRAAAGEAAMDREAEALDERAVIVAERKVEDKAADHERHEAADAMMEKRHGSDRHGFGEFSGTHKMEARKPEPGERIAANRLAATLERITFHDRAVTRVDRVLPGGKLRPGAALQRAADRARGGRAEIPVWRAKERKQTPETPVTVGIMTDVSGSMSRNEQPSAVTTYVVSQAVSTIEGKVATTVFGTRGYLVHRAYERSDMVQPWDACDGHEAFRDSALLIDAELNILDGEGARVLVIFTDSHFVNPVHKQYASTFMRLCKARNVAVVWCNYGGMPISNYGHGALVALSGSAADIANTLGAAIIKEVSKIEAARSA